MKDYLKLVHMEVHRFRYFLIGLISLTVICQFGTLMIYTSRAESRTWLFSDGKFSFSEVINDVWPLFNIPILLSVIVLFAYIFLIWYRDWIGKSAFIYRLLMLPAARRNLYWAKLTAFLIFVFSLVAFQMLLFSMEHWVFNAMIPSVLREPFSLSEIITIIHYGPFSILLPRTFDQFLFNYGLGTLAVIVIFTSILLERSYSRIGILYALLYPAICIYSIIFPLILWDSGVRHYLYFEEWFAMELTIVFIILVGSIGLSIRLLNKKITV